MGFQHLDDDDNNNYYSRLLLKKEMDEVESEAAESWSNVKGV